MDKKKAISFTGRSIVALAIILSAFHIYTAFFGNFTAVIQRGIHLTLAMVLLFLIRPVSVKYANKFTHTYNWLLIVLAIVSQIYLLINATPAKLVERAVTGPTTNDLIIGGIMLLTVIEAARRISLPLAIVTISFLLYGYFGNYMPSIIAHRGYSFQSIVDHMMFSTEGIYGVALAVSATIVALFIIFGAFLEESGGGNFFVNLAYALTGRFKSGPALSSVLSSSLMGSISGSAVANVATTGTFTIPLMKKVGYHSRFAGAVEAAASTGGQLMPPVMGAGAFIMAEVLGVPYMDIVLAAIIPAFLFYLGIGWIVHLETEKQGIQSLSHEERPKIKKTLVSGFHFLIPLAVLITMLFYVATTPLKAALFAIITVIVVSFRSQDSAMNYKRIVNALVKGGKGIIDVAVACAAAGVIIGIFTLTGLGLKLSNLVITLSQGNLLLALLLTMVACIILGMGVPTAAAYIITATLVAPALVDLGVVPLAAHFFIFYFAIISAITPPVALAAFAGAGIAGTSAMRTAFTASRIGIVAFIVPYMIVYAPSLILIGSIGEIAVNCVSAVIGILFLGMGVQGWMVKVLHPAERIFLIATSLMMIIPGILTDSLGFVGVTLFVIWLLQILKKREFAREKYGVN